MLNNKCWPLSHEALLRCYMRIRHYGGDSRRSAVWWSAHLCNCLCGYLDISNSFHLSCLLQFCVSLTGVAWLILLTCLVLKRHSEDAFRQTEKELDEKRICGKSEQETLLVTWIHNISTIVNEKAIITNERIFILTCISPLTDLIYLVGGHDTVRTVSSVSRYWQIPSWYNHMGWLLTDHFHCAPSYKTLGRKYYLP